jgi:hypothetical protein
MVRKLVAGVAAGAAVIAGTLGLAPAAQASSGSLAEALGVDPVTAGSFRTDRNWHDFDILREAAEVVLATNPGSPIGVLADGSAPVTAFLPDDRAFRVLEASLTGSWERTEKAVITGLVTALGGPARAAATFDTVIQYHLLEDAAVRSNAVLGLKGKPRSERTFTTQQGGTIVFQVWSAKPAFPVVSIGDQDRDAPNPFLVPWKLDITAGSQIAHGISGVLRPVDLPRG